MTFLRLANIWPARIRSVRRKSTVASSEFSILTQLRKSILLSEATLRHQAAVLFCRQRTRCSCFTTNISGLNTPWSATVFCKPGDGRSIFKTTGDTITRGNARTTSGYATTLPNPSWICAILPMSHGAITARLDGGGTRRRLIRDARRRARHRPQGSQKARATARWRCRRSPPCPRGWHGDRPPAHQSRAPAVYRRRGRSENNADPRSGDARRAATAGTAAAARTGAGIPPATARHRGIAPRSLESWWRARETYRGAIARTAPSRRDWHDPAIARAESARAM